MSYYLYKMQFTTPLHVGDSRLANGLETAQLNICADTLFSALCHTIIQLDGESRLSAFIDKVSSNEILFSDTFPYKQGVLYIPKPFMNSRSNKEADMSRRKLMKKLSYIPLSTLNEFIGSITGTNNFDPQSIDNDFAENTVDTKVNLSENISRPYAVAGVSFYPECGLYGVLKAADKSEAEHLKNMLKMLGLGGIGGKISSGYGKFELTDFILLDESDDKQYRILYQALENNQSGFHITLTTALPTDSELEHAVDGAAYKLVRRGGFMYSTAMDKPMKKQTQYCFCAGSVFKNKFCGDVYNVAVNAPHPAYRYLKPIFMGVDI